MAEKMNHRRRCALVYPKHAFQPEDLLRFVELKPFAAAWKDLKLDDQDLEALQVLIMLNPAGSPIVQGTGGLRKMRFAPSRWAKGKSGAARVGYVYLQDHGTIFLVIAYAKDEKDDLTPVEKEVIRKLIQRIELEFDSGLIR